MSSNPPRVPMGCGGRWPGGAFSTSASWLVRAAAAVPRSVCQVPATCMRNWSPRVSIRRVIASSSEAILALAAAIELESEALIQLILFGNGLNLAKPSRASGLRDDIAARRAAGPSKRVDPDVRAELAEVFTRWVTGPARYTEVAETLAGEVSRYCDDTAGPDGWRIVADQWLQPGGLAVTDFRNCYHLLYSQSQHLDSNLL
ncbi:hypothetical protein AB0F43_31045 [Kribbella sp. NPDC023972]|uniref:hypothetical protein n=1 Tax=Kribbella sp. NPDC023972 TaxID=3154795 RepID=UPI0033DC5FDB